MIKVNVEIDNKSWRKKIKNPQKYFNAKLRKISKINKFFKNKNIVFTILRYFNIIYSLIVLLF